MKSLIYSMLRIGTVGFGGGSALIPVIEKEIVEKKQLLSEDMYNKNVVVASITPGALPVEIASGIGYQLAGIRGMIAAAGAMAFPGAFLTLLFLMLFSGITPQLQLIFHLFSIIVTIGIILMLLQYVFSTLKQADTSKVRLLDFLLILLVFLLCSGKNICRLFQLDTFLIPTFSTIEILSGAFCIILTINLISWICRQKSTVTVKKYIDAPQKVLQHIMKSLFYWIIITLIMSLPAILLTRQTISFLCTGFLSSILSFGGGDAYLSVAEGLFIGADKISTAEFYGTIVVVANALPGSILCKVLTGIGYTLGYHLHSSVFEGILLAIAGFSCSVASSGAIFTVVCGLYEKYEQLPLFSSLRRSIRPIMSGLLLNVALSLLLQLSIT